MGVYTEAKRAHRHQTDGAPGPTSARTHSRPAAPAAEAAGPPTLGETLNQSSRVATQLRLGHALNSGPRSVVQARLATLAQRRAADEEEELVAQRKTPEEAQATVGTESGTKGGLPDSLRSGIETLSGMSMGDVQVEYNSPEPAKLGALATTQGKSIQLGPGQEKHLPHEAWHAAQQKQGRVRATTQMYSVALNTDPALEHEADVMGARAERTGATLQRQARGSELPGPARRESAESDAAPRQLRAGHQGAGVIQRAVGFEFETEQWTLSPRSRLSPPLDGIKNWKLAKGNGWYMQPDGDSVEFATRPFDEGDFLGLNATMADMFAYTGQLVAAMGAGATPVSSYPGYTYTGTLYNVVPGDAAMAASPQFTAGVSLTSLRTMMSQLGTQGTTAQAQLNNQPAYGYILAQAAAGAQIVGFSEEYRGIVALMGSYTAASANLQFATFYKDIAALMSRTSFGTTFEETPEYQAAAGNAALMTALKVNLRNHVIASAQHVFAGGGPPHHAINAGLRMLPGIYRGGAIPGRTGPTLQEWTNSVADGGDALKGSYWNLVKWMWANNTIGTGAVTSTAMGTMDNTEPTGPGQVESPILEYRNLPTGVPRAQWQPLAHRLLRWVTRLNSPAIHRKSY